MVVPPLHSLLNLQEQILRLCIQTFPTLSWKPVSNPLHISLTDRFFIPKDDIDGVSQRFQSSLAVNASAFDISLFDWKLFVNASRNRSFVAMSVLDGFNRLEALRAQCVGCDSEKMMTQNMYLFHCSLVEVEGDVMTMLQSYLPVNQEASRQALRQAVSSPNYWERCVNASPFLPGLPSSCLSFQSSRVALRIGCKEYHVMLH